MFNLHAFHNPNQKFHDYFRCYPISMMAGPSRESLNYGGKIILPPSALDRLSRLNITYPMLFELKNEFSGKITYSGVLEFIAEEGRVYLPNWMLRSLGLGSGELIVIESATLMQGSFLKIQPQSTDFLDISDPKAVLENSLRNFSTLTVDDIFEISYNDHIYAIKVLEVRPESDSHSISVVETDIEVDFAPPVGYVEPTPASSVSAAASRSITPAINTPGAMAATIGYNDMLASASQSSLSSFQGQGQRLSGRSRSVIPSPAHTDAKPATTTAHLQADSPPLPLNLSYGTFFFGFPLIPLPPETDNDDAPEQSEPQLFAGVGQSLRASRKRKESGGQSRRVRQHSADAIEVD
ncbi:hypothetical protein CANCADRAFT_21097 [Tortispora caseinolytica NRRL Y-17796]|uniref:Ubiquitin fusion degradation protein 1 n=1 Tax=Tortispora caseinolytica NRRL Y-17796 TaxID=767744 RepID=A0A1E4TKG9_9ASCO|nr:hypothetical protein CANCADRAFT_21097 [Tortispora caseinolytica NRRL Y-17796]